MCVRAFVRSCVCACACACACVRACGCVYVGVYACMHRYDVCLFLVLSRLDVNMARIRMTRWMTLDHPGTVPSQSTPLGEPYLKYPTRSTLLEVPHSEYPT